MLPTPAHQRAREGTCFCRSSFLLGQEKLVHAMLLPGQAGEAGRAGQRPCSRVSKPLPHHGHQPLHQWDARQHPKPKDCAAELTLTPTAAKLFISA